jgi:type IX secretion system PorP/SprF family membrane protein
MKNTLLLFILLFTFTSSQAQDPLFTQKTGNINHFNPALVGTQTDFGVQINYRNQWPSLPGKYITSSLLTNYNLKNKIGFGLELKTDRSGDLLFENNAKANINYQFKAKEVEIRVGTSLGLHERNIDPAKVRFEDQIDPSHGFVKATAEPYTPLDPVSVFVADVGVASYYKGFSVGISAFQFNGPNISLSGGEVPYPMRIVGIFGYHRSLGSVNIGGLVTYQKQKNFTAADYQVTGQHKFIKLGYGLRQNFGEYTNTLWHMASIGVQFDKLSVGYNYEHYSLGRTSLSSHEATAAWYIKGLNKQTGLGKFINTIL